MKEKKVLFDAGFFVKDSNSKRILDYIFITHFHWDRIAGLIDENDNIIYKNAKIYVSKEEYDGWINKMPAKKMLYK